MSLERGAGYRKLSRRDRKVSSYAGAGGSKKARIAHSGCASSGDGADCERHVEDWNSRASSWDEVCEKKIKNVEPHADQSLAKSTSTTLPVVCENKLQQKQFPVLSQPVEIKFLETLARVLKDADIEPMNLEGGMDSCVACLLSHESHNIGSESAHWTQIHLDSICKLGQSEVTNFPPGPSHVEEDFSRGELNKTEESSVNQVARADPFDMMRISTMKTNPLVSILVELDIQSLDDLHDLLHPSSDEAELLGEMLQTLGAGEDETFSTMSSMEINVEQNETMISAAHTDNTGPVGDDYIELADLEYPLDQELLTLGDGFEMDEEQESKVSHP